MRRPDVLELTGYTHFPQSLVRRALRLARKVHPRSSGRTVATLFNWFIRRVDQGRPKTLELLGELLVMPADPFAGAVVGVPAHIRAEPARRRRAAECLGHRADVVGCAAATDAEVVDSERSRRRRERGHLVAVGQEPV